MLYGASIAFEVRAEGGATRLSGRFPYRAVTTLGAGRKERFAARAFGPRIDAGETVYLLAGHDPEKPLASTEAGSLVLRDGDDALEIEARVVPSTSWAHDALAALADGLIKGLSPGFVVRPGGDYVQRSEGGLIRTVKAADLHELSLVARPAYPDAQLAARLWQLALEKPRVARWR